MLWLQFAIPAVLGAASFFGNRAKRQGQEAPQQFLFDARQPPTIIDIFSQLGFAPRERDVFTSALAPIFSEMLFRALGMGRGPTLKGGLPQADSVGPFSHLDIAPRDRITPVKVPKAK